MVDTVSPVPNPEGLTEKGVSVVDVCIYFANDLARRGSLMPLLCEL